MAGMNVFNNSLFSMASLSGTVEKIDYVPQTLGQLGIFSPMPVRTRDIWVDRREGKLTLIPTSALGAPPEELVTDDRNGVPLRTVRLTKGFTLYAHEIEGIRQFGSQTELMQVQAEYLRRLAQVRNDMELTHEFHRLGALQGLLLDADGTKVIYDYFSEFEVAQPAPISLDLDNPNAALRVKMNQIIRDMVRNSKGAIPPNATIHALAGDTFYDKLISHAQVEKTYLNWAAAADLRKGTAFQSFTYGDITWHNYRGTDDNSVVAVNPNEARLFPVGAPDVFKKAMAPAEFGPFVNTMGRDNYAINIRDLQRDAWVRGEIYSYPLYFCQRPEALRIVTV